MYFAVGNDDGEGWIAVNVQSEEIARRAYCDEWLAADEPVPDNIIAIRVPAWDGLGRAPTGAEWVNAGLSYSCSEGCGGMVFLEEGGKVVDGEPVCEYCLPETHV